MFKRVKQIVITFLTILSVSTAWAAEPIILTVHTGVKVFDYTLSMLDQLPQHEIRTDTPWTPEHRFTGPLLSDLISETGLNHKKIRAIALNDYAVELDPALTRTHPVLLATRMDNAPMRIRNKGPIWIVFPLQSHPELNVADVHSQMVWQLRRLEISQ